MQGTPAMRIMWRGRPRPRPLTLKLTLTVDLDVDVSLRVSPGRGRPFRARSEAARQCRCYVCTRGSACRALRSMVREPPFRNVGRSIFGQLGALALSRDLMTVAAAAAGFAAAGG